MEGGREEGREEGEGPPRGETKRAEEGESGGAKEEEEVEEDDDDDDKDDEGYAKSDSRGCVILGLLDEKCLMALSISCDANEMGG